MKTKFIVVLLFVLMASLSTYGLVGCSQVSQTYVKANVDHANLADFDLIDYILADPALSKDSKKVRVLAILENIKLNAVTAKEIIKQNESEILNKILQVEARLNKLE